MSHPYRLPGRGPGELAAAGARLSAPGSCCPHLFGAHRRDGACSLAGVQACTCTGWRPADLTGQPVTAVVVDEPLDTDALLCSTVGCGHRADRHYAKPDERGGFGPCRLDGCPCGQWSYARPDDDVIDAEVLAPVHDAVRAVLFRYVAGPQLDQAVEDVVDALPRSDVAEYFGLVDPPSRPPYVDRAGRRHQL